MNVHNRNCIWHPHPGRFGDSFHPEFPLWTEAHQVIVFLLQGSQEVRAWDSTQVLTRCKEVIAELSNSYGFVPLADFEHEIGKILTEGYQYNRLLLHVLKNNIKVIKNIQHNNDELSKQQREYSKLVVEPTIELETFEKDIKSSKLNKTNNSIVDKIVSFRNSDDLGEYLEENNSLIDEKTLKLAILKLKIEINEYYKLKKEVTTEEDLDIINLDIDELKDKIEVLHYFIDIINGKTDISESDKPINDIFFFESSALNPLILNDLKDMDRNYLKRVKGLIDSLIYDKPKCIKKFVHNSNISNIYEVRDISGKVRVTFVYITPNKLMLLSAFKKKNNGVVGY